MVFCLKPQPFAVLDSIPNILRHRHNLTGSNQLQSDLCVKSSMNPVFVICTYDSKEDIYVSRAIQTAGIWEPKMTELFRNILKSIKNATVIDVGANIGYFSLMAASLGQNVIAIEPVEDNIQKLVQGVLVNEFQDNIVILRNAVSRGRGVVRLDVSSETNQGASRIIMNEEVTNGGKTTKIASVTLDDLVNFIKTENVVIKIDIGKYMTIFVHILINYFA